MPEYGVYLEAICISQTSEDEYTEMIVEIPFVFPSELKFLTEKNQDKFSNCIPLFNEWLRRNDYKDFNVESKIIARNIATNISENDYIKFQPHIYN